MPYRMIALFCSQVRDIPDVAHYYEASLKDGELFLVDPDAGAGGEAAHPPLDGLIKEACRKEWKVRLNLYGRSLDDLERGGDSILVKLSHWLRRCELWDMDDRGAEVPRDAIGLIRDLSNDAKKIRSRKTVFLVPEDRRGIGSDPKELERVISDIAHELAGLLDAVVTPLNIGFLRMRPLDRQTKAEPFATAKTRPIDRRSRAESDALGIMPDIVRKIFMQNDHFLGKGINFYGKDGPLLMDGPTGTGKSMAAELIAHRQRKPFVKINIAGTSDALLESQMRGHTKGAFTGAETENDGWFAEADGGVLFLDEFQNASLVSQTQLLDLLDPMSNAVFINRVGETHRRRFDVKVILAVNRPIDELLSEEKLRSDLFYRIRDVVILRSLNEILGDVEGAEKQVSAIRRLFYIYRWKSSPFWGDRVEGEADFASLFPVIDESVVEPIVNFQWLGNYRQFERFVSDIHWRNDMQNRFKIGQSIVVEQLSEESSRTRSTLPPIANRQQAWAQNRVREVEDCLRKNGFIIEKALLSLKPLGIGLGSRASLRSFLREHHDSLGPEVRNDSRVAQFLHGRSK